ncbi:S8 family peptidase [Rossellomorea aquimaris]|uniref:Peptidase S8 n=1 Tax=Rossellomorea aquimaris TaxID=189382 RepID=A0A1J6W759_9BACI|nr:Ig-like domain-containing protein [Rossellomorea aquimaris]OIU67696.1 peptidase S8 [Rossellomorea aquimaris]
MGKKWFSSLLVLMLFFSYSLSDIPMVKAAGEEMPVLDAETLEQSITVEDEFEGGETIQWYKVTPSAEDIGNFTHFRINLQSQEEVTVTVYASLDKAIANEAFDRYRGYSYSDEAASIDFPLAWTGPYYIKAESYPMEEEADEGGARGSYSLAYEGVALPPSHGGASEECPAELSTKEKENGKAILQDMRTIRDTLLSENTKGKEWTSLYYKAAPFISAKILFNKKAREEVYTNLDTLKNLLSDTADNGKYSSYTISPSEQKAIQSLHMLAYEAVPAVLQKQMGKALNGIDLEKVSGSTVAALLGKTGLIEASAAAEQKLIVKVKDNQSANKVISKVKSYGTQSVSMLSSQTSQLLVVDLNDEEKGYHATAASTEKQIEKLPEVEYVEPVQTYRALSTDTSYPYQWSLENPEIETGDIGYDALESLLQGKQLPSTMIAVVDTGVDHSLADLSDQVASDKGKNFVDRTADASDDNGHGTHVASIIAAKANNHYSIAGINPFAVILPVKVLDASGSGDTEQIAYGIMYAADQGAKVINLSLGGPYSRTIEYALQYASKKGAVIVAASGNDGFEEVSYPASSKYAISVGSTNKLNIVSDFSNYGTGLDMVAPGSEIPALLPDGNVSYMSGTSMAAPHVSAAAGLLLSQKPGLAAGEVEKLLTETSRDIAFEELDNPMNQYEEDPYQYEEEYPYPEEELLPGYDMVSGWGSLNALSAYSVGELLVNVNPVLNNQTKVTGKAKTGSTVKVMNGSKVLGTAAAKSGAFSVTIPIQKTDQILNVTVTGGSAEASIRKVVEKAPDKPKVKRVTNKDSYVSGNAAAGLKVTIKNTSKKVIASGKVNDEGSFKIKIPNQKAGTVLYASAVEGYKESTEVKLTVADAIPPGAPKVKAVSDKSTVMTGTGEAYAFISAKVKGKQIASAKANSKGSFTLKIKKQKAGATITVTAKDKAGNVSKGTNIKVSDKTPPPSPKVNKVTSKDKVVKGKSEAGAAITVRAKNKTIGTGKADKKGSFSVKIKQQKAMSVLTVTAKDKAKNVSQGKKVTVKSK